MSEVSWLLKAAEQAGATLGAHERLVGVPEKVVPALERFVGRVSQAENPALALSKAIAAEELISAKALAAEVKAGRAGNIPAEKLGFKDELAKKLDAGAGLAPKEAAAGELSEDLNWDNATDEQLKAAFFPGGEKAAAEKAEGLLSKVNPGAAPSEYFDNEAAWNYLERLEKTGTGGDRALDKMGLQYLIFMKSAPTNYYEAKVFRHLPISKARAFYAPAHLVEEGNAFNAAVAQYVSEGDGLEHATSKAAEVHGYESRHMGTLINAMKKRKVPIVSEMGELLKYTWAVPIIGPSAVYIAGGKDKR